MSHPVEPVCVDLAPGGPEFRRQLLSAFLAPVEADDVAARDVTERPHVPYLNEHGAARVVSERHPCLENHVQPRLGCQPLFLSRIARGPMFFPQSGLVVGREQDDDGAGPTDALFEYASDVG